MTVVASTFDEAKHPRHPPGSEQGGEFAERVTRGIPDDQRVYIAEGALERGGLAGRSWDFEMTHRDDPNWHESDNGRADAAATEYARAATGMSDLRVVFSNWVGGGTKTKVKAEYDSFQRRITARPGVSDLTLLHEAAHALSGTEEGPGGHGDEFRRAATRLYAEHLSLEAADLFERLANPSLRAAAWDETKHPREPGGTEKGGEFASKEGGREPRWIRPNRGADPEWWTTVKPLYHITTRDRLPLILERGLEPPTAEARRDPTSGASRLGHVYMFANPTGVDQYWRWREEDPAGTVILEVDPRKLEPKRVKADEDFVEWHVEMELAARKDQALADQLNTHKLHNYRLPPVREKQTLGDWAEEQGLDIPSMVRDSYEDWGSVAYEGGIPPGAIRVREDLDPSTGKLRGIRAAAWDATKHPRHPEGDERGGEFAEKSGDVPSGFPPGIWSPEDTVKFWPREIYSYSGFSEELEGPFWKAIVDRDNEELAFWFAGSGGSPHHQQMAEALGIPEEGDWTAVAGYGDKADLGWIRGYYADIDKFGHEADEILALIETEESHELYGKYGLLLGDYEGMNRREIRQELREDRLRELAKVPGRHRRDIRDAREMANPPLAASATPDFQDERLVAAERRLQRQYEIVYRRAAKRAAAAYRAVTKVVTAAGQPQPEEVLQAVALLESFLRLTGVARRALLKEILVALGVLHADRQDVLRAYLPLLEAQIGVQASRLVAGTQDAVADVLLDAMAQGWPVPQTATAIKEKLETIAPWQARMLARTDLVATANGASLQRAVVLDDPGSAFKTWLATPDERTRVDHRHAHGQTVQIQQPFTVGGEQMLYPGDPSASDGNVLNCRCTLVYGATPFGPENIKKVTMVDLALSAAANDHWRWQPRDPGGEGGGQWVKAVTDDGIERMQTPFGSFELGRQETAISPEDAALNEEIITAFQKRPKTQAYYMITAPLRRTPETMSQARAIWRAVDGDVDAVARVMDSATKWGFGWREAEDEWLAAQALGGSGQMSTALKKALKDAEPLPENVLKAFKARQQWHQEKFRELFGDDGVLAYRGITGKRASAPWLDAQEASKQSDKWFTTFGEASQAEFKRRQKYYDRYEHPPEAPNPMLGDMLPGPIWQLSSWTTSGGDASTFAFGSKSRKSGVVVATRVRPEDIWMMPRYGGQGALSVADVGDEFVLLNPEETRDAGIAG